MNKKVKWILIFCGVIFLLYSYFSGYYLQPIHSPTLIIINFYLNEHYHHEFSEIQEDGNHTINRIVSDTSDYGKNPYRLNVIADKIAENFTDMYWLSQQNEKYFCYYTDSSGKGEWTWCPPFNGIFGKNPRSYGYVTDKKGRVRSILANDITFSPKWIAYQKTGACEAISILFNETANRSGFISRIVSSDSAGHFWNEVKVNGEWKYYDIQRYGQVKNTSEESFWFGNRTEYGRRSGFTYSELTKNGICVFNIATKKCGNESVTQAYLEQSHDG